MWETHTSQYINGALCSDDAFNATVDALPLQIGVGFSIAVSFTFSQSFSYSCNFVFYVLLRTFLLKKPLNTLAFSTPFDFPVSVCILDFFLSLVCLSVFVVGGILLGSTKVFSPRFLGLVTGGI